MAKKDVPLFTRITFQDKEILNEYTQLKDCSLSFAIRELVRTIVKERVKQLKEKNNNTQEDFNEKDINGFANVTV